MDLSAMGSSGEVSQIDRIVGMAGGWLMVVLQVGEGVEMYFKLLALDPHTGKIVWQVHNTQGYDFGQSPLLKGVVGLRNLQDLQINKDQTRLLSLNDNYLLEIEAHTGNILRYKQIDLHDDEQSTYSPTYQGRLVKIRRGLLNGDYFYFTGNDITQHYSSFPSELGVFNLKTEQIEWSERVVTKPVFLINTPQVAGNKLYVLDNQGTLHIFERETELI